MIGFDCTIYIVNNFFLWASIWKFKHWNNPKYNVFLNRSAESSRTTTTALSLAPKRYHASQGQPYAWWCSTCTSKSRLYSSGSEGVHSLDHPSCNIWGNMGIGISREVSGWDIYPPWNIVMYFNIYIFLQAETVNIIMLINAIVEQNSIIWNVFLLGEKWTLIV